MSLALAGGSATTAAEPCAALTPYVVEGRLAELEQPARLPNPLESARIDAAGLDLLQQADYSKGALLVDADNDGIEDLVVWNISGSLRYVYTELRGWSLAPAATDDLPLRATFDLGVIEDPRFVRLDGVQYLVYSHSGSIDDTTVSRIDVTATGEREQRAVCRMQTRLHAETRCRHPACRALASRIEDGAHNAPFVDIEWPHKYFGPAGLAVYFPADGSRGDFDNSGAPTAIWRYGREGYVNEHIYWALLGQGDAAPDVDPALRPLSEDPTPRRVLPGAAHTRLRHTLAGQQAALAAALGTPIGLPDGAEFFLFEAHGGRTYWAWDFGTPPTGEAIHIAYTRGAKSDYIGEVGIRRELALQPCTADCVIEPQQ
jgi:hypothetical protein